MPAPSLNAHAATKLNVLKERSRLSHEQLARWRGLPLCWVDAAASVSAGYHAYERTVLAFLDAGQAQGEFDFVTRREHIDIEAGSMGLFLPGEVHACRWRSSDVRRILVEIDPGVLASQGLAADEDLARTLRPALVFRDGQLGQLLRSMAQEVAQGCPNGHLFAQSASVSLVMRLQELRSARSPLAKERGRLTERQLASVAAFIEAHLAGDISLSAMAAEVGLSAPHFARLFRNATGCSPHRYVLARKVERACELLRHTTIPLSRVAAAAGFSAQSHMNAAVKACHGVTPGQIRRSLTCGEASTSASPSETHPGAH